MTYLLTILSIALFIRWMQVPWTLEQGWLHLLSGGPILWALCFAAALWHFTLDLNTGYFWKVRRIGVGRQVMTNKRRCDNG